MTDKTADTGAALDLTLPLEAAEIMRIIPHRYPFLLIDRVVQLEGHKRAVGINRLGKPRRAIRSC